MTKHQLWGRLATWATASVLTVGLAACGGSDEQTAAASDADKPLSERCSTLNVLTWEGYADPAYTKPFTAKYGVPVKATYASSDTELVAKAATQKGDFAVVSVNGAVRRRQSASGAIQPLDVSKLEHYGTISEKLKSPLVLDGKVWGAPQNWGVNPFIFNRSVLSAADAQAKGYEILWDARLKDKLGLWNEVAAVYIGATVLGFDEAKDPEAEGGTFNLTDDQLEQIKQKMLTLKPQVRAAWGAGGELVQLFSNGEVDASPGWASIYQQLVDAGKGKTFDQTVFEKAGASAWVDGIGIGAEVSSGCVDAAYAWINWMTEAKMQATLVDVTGYSPAQDGAREFLKPAQIKAAGVGQEDELLGKALVRVDPARPDEYQKTTEAIFAGLR